MSSILAIHVENRLTNNALCRYKDGTGWKFRLHGVKIGYNRWCGEMSSQIRRDAKLQSTIRSIAIKWDSPWGIYIKNIAEKRY